MSKTSTCFVAMPFEPASYRRKIFEKAIEPAVKLFGLSCRIADHYDGDLYDQVEKGLRESEICIADISTRPLGGKPRDRSNVTYELAHTLGKKTIILVQKKSKPLFSTNRWKNITYRDAANLKEQLIAALEEVIEFDPSRTCVLPRALRSASAKEFVVSQSHLTWRMGRKRKGGFPEIASVGGDALIAASLFDRLKGFGLHPYTVNPYDYEDRVVKRPMNLICIGSSRANPWTPVMMDGLAKRWTPTFRFDWDSEDPRSEVQIIAGNNREISFGIEPSFGHDLGLVIRAPNPYASGKMVLILAGRRVTGTEAAFFALSDVNCLERLAERVDLDDYRQAFCMAVAMKRHGRDRAYEPDLSSLEVKKVWTLKRRS